MIALLGLEPKADREIRMTGWFGAPAHRIRDASGAGISENLARPDPMLLRRRREGFRLIGSGRLRRRTDRAPTPAIATLATTTMR